MKGQIFYGVNVQEHSESMTLLHGARPRELNLGIKSWVGVPVS
jgi:hypothetical protein